MSVWGKNGFLKQNEKTTFRDDSVTAATAQSWQMSC